MRAVPASSARVPCLDTGIHDCLLMLSREGTTTRTEGATRCEVSVAGGLFSRLDDVLGSADVAILLSFGLLLDGTNLESVSR